MAKKEYFMLYANCIVVEGVTRGIIVDLQRSRYKFIPLLLADIMKQMKEHKYTLKMLKEAYNHEYDDGIDLFLESLNNEEYGIFTNDIVFFPDLSLEYDFPAKISNVILDLDKHSSYFIDKLIPDFNALGVKALEIRFFDEVTFDRVKSILKLIDHSCIRSIELLIQCSSFWTTENIEQLFVVQRRLERVILSSAPDDKKIASDYLDIFWIKQKVKSSKCCGQFGYKYFNTHLNHFMESQHYNTCLNRKLSIDVNGNIKNCPSMAQSFGYVGETCIKEVLRNQDFLKLWNIKKSDIQKCKNCEFRHICTDCRAYLENPKDLYSAPLKCGYDPQTGEWEDWSTNPLKKESIEYYQL